MLFHVQKNPTIHNKVVIINVIIVIVIIPAVITETWTNHEQTLTYEAYEA